MTITAMLLAKKQLTAEALTDLNLMDLDRTVQANRMDLNLTAPANLTALPTVLESLTALPTDPALLTVLSPTVLNRIGLSQAL